MISLTLVLVLGATFAIIWFFNRDNEGKKFKKIPGPRSFPIVGNILQIGKKPHIQFNKWTKEYGSIYQMNLGNIRAIMIADPKMLKEILLTDPNYVGRPNMDGFDLYNGEKLGIVNSEGEMWEVHRRFLLRQLRDFGFGKSAMEGLIMEELNEIISRWKACEGRPITNIKETLTLAVINSLWAVVSAQRFRHDDPKLMKLVSNTSKVIKDLFENGGVIIFMPWLRHIIPEASGFNAFRRVIEENRAWFEETLEEHKKTFDENCMRDFIDVYLAEVKKTTDPNSVFYGSLAERQLVTTLADLFFAGSDTTSTTLAWAILYLSKFPSVQKKFQEEIASITNNSRNVSVADRPSMPYTLALIDEILRYSSIVPNGVQHRALAAKEFQGYYIPKDALIMPNMHYIHYDPDVWGDPENFRPERFLSDDGQKYKKSENLIPFQIGRRQCVGETLARDTIFLYLTNIFQKFTVSFDPNSPEPTLESMSSFLLHPQPYSVVMKDRSAN